MLSALLTGVNRARPYLPPGDEGVEGRTASLFRVVHTGGFATATQALSLLFQVGREDGRGGGGGGGRRWCWEERGVRDGVGGGEGIFLEREGSKGGGGGGGVGDGGVRGGE